MRLNRHVTNDPSLGAGHASTNIFSHPLRVRGAIRQKKVLGQQLSKEKRIAEIKLEKLISDLEAMRTADNASDLDWSINEVVSVLADIRKMDFEQAFEQNSFAQFSARVLIAHSAAVTRNCTSALENVRKIVGAIPKSPSEKFMSLNIAFSASGELTP